MLHSRTTVALLATAALLASASAQNRIGTGTVDETYIQFCASCHDGGQGSSLVDGVWKYGSSDAEIAASIRNGIPNTEMVPWGTVLSDEQIRSLVIYLREKAQLAAREQTAVGPKKDGATFRSQEHAFRLEKVADGTGILWGIEFLPDASMLVTQRDGILWHIEGDRRVAIDGIPEVWDQGQGGLMEVQAHPDYQRNGWIYLGYSESAANAFGGESDAGMTTVARGRIRDGKWVDQERIYRAPSEFYYPTRHHFGTRFVFKDGYLFFAIGDRGRQDQAQDLSRPNGKIHRIFDDGRVPSDNPFSDTPNALPTIWSYGHRNPQGLDLHPETGDIWEVEHGPRGGDETNLIEPGLNYGWPVITYGMNYSGTPITSLTEKEGMEQPEHYWVPSIAICGIDFYDGDRFPAWKNNLFVSGMASQELHRLVIEDRKVVADEIVLSGQGRIRDVYSGPDGYLYLLLIDSDTRVGSVYRMAPDT